MAEAEGTGEVGRASPVAGGMAAATPSGQPLPEAACEMPEKLARGGIEGGRVILADALPHIGSDMGDEARPVIEKALRDLGVETRTSSPVRITRGQDFQSLNTAGLYPAGEGAGYAGGILSAAVDGIKVAEAVARSYVAEGLIEAC